MSETSEISLRVTSERSLAEEWALVLVSEGFSPRVRPADEGFVLSVPTEEAQQSHVFLSAYENENAKPQQREEPTAAADAHTGLGVSAALLAFFLVTGPRNPTVLWFERGTADAERILQGEPWRTVTALTLHADGAHVLSNAAAGAIFLSAVCGTLGPGLGCALALLAGAVGNLLTALFHGSSHVSVGASTSVFGAVGVLGGVGVLRRRRIGVRGRRTWVPIAASLALLAMLGTGPRADLWAHLYGLLVGIVLGISIALTVPHPPGFRAQCVLGGLTAAAIIYCWMIALN